MTNNNVIEKLVDLVQLDIDAIHAYKQALKEITTPKIKENITKFKHDHERHVADLEEIIVELGGQVPKHQQDIKGYLLEGFTAIQSKMGEKMALRAMQANEKLTNKRYADALNLEMTSSVREVVEKNRMDEKRHLEYINSVLEQEPIKG